MSEKLNLTYTFNVALKKYPTEGNLVYEYNPFYNYRLNKKMFYYKSQLMTEEELCKELGISKLPTDSWDNVIPNSEVPPVVYQAGLLVDFETDELKFDLSNPVNITPLYSYDNSVNLIINDGKNPPRLINSRFSATERNKYQVCNRKGNNDSNIYDLGEQFDIDTSLYKKINTIPKLKFLGVGYGGNLSIGNYHFYFRYVDEDGNESDFFAESGLVSVFIGNSANSIYSGLRDENSYKLVKFLISNTDAGYSKISVYYTKSTSDVDENAYVLSKKILQEYTINNSGDTIITISGFEETIDIPSSEINTFYQIYGSAETQATALNMLFLANVDKVKTPYEDLADCALRFIPELDTTELYSIDQLKKDYTGTIKNTYYDPNYIYNKVGYWDDEIYRFGVVFIKSDNTLTEVFNVRGGMLGKDSTPFLDISFKENEERNYISYDEHNFQIIGESKYSSLENAKGVVHINHPDFNSVIGIKFKIKPEVLIYLLETLHIKGYFFVRLKRIPTTLCLAYTIGIDKESHTPVLPIYDDKNVKYISEGFLTTDKLLDHDSKDRIYTLENLQVNILGAICPEYDVNYPYLNTLFSGSELVCRNCADSNYLEKDSKHLYPINSTFTKTDTYNNIKVIGVEDDTKLVGINDYLFSARAGEAEEAFRFEYIGKKSVNTDSTNLIRGSFGPFLGITGYNNAGHLIDIKIPGYNPTSMREYFEIRYLDKSAYYAISERYAISEYKLDMESELDAELDSESNDYYMVLSNPLYRGDCYICQFTHRFNRNFQDPSSPTNDDIVDSKCWKDNFKVTDGVVVKENFEKINLGDVNAVMLGMYITLTVRSTLNLNIRSIDNSIPDEEALFGHARGFYPYFPMTIKGSYKTPEALCYNKGFEKSVSEKLFFEAPDVPWIKNEFSNRIAYSNILIQDAFLNGWRTFMGSHYRDYPKTYGSITKIIELRGDLLCVFEHGVALIPINERTVAGEGNGGNIYINTSNVLPLNPKIISDVFGSLWRDSIIKTPRGVYGVDTVAKKIWRTNGLDFECISDFRVLEFLNKNISLTERELEPIIGIRNVKTHYNQFKGDVMFTFYDNLHGFEEKVWNLCFNESLQKWITFYSWVPSYSENIYNQYYSFDRNTSKWISKLGISRKDNSFSDGIVLDTNVIPNNATHKIETLYTAISNDYIGTILNGYVIIGINRVINNGITSYNVEKGYCVGRLDLVNRTLPSGDGITVTKTFKLNKDNFGNYKNFGIINNYLYLKTDAVNLCSELFIRGTKSNGKYTEIITDPKNLFELWKNNCVLNSNYCICKDDLGRRSNLAVSPNDNRLNPHKIVTLLNIECKIDVLYEGTPSSLVEAYASGSTNSTTIDAGYYKSVVAVIPKYNLLFLTTNFWKHGLAGIIDISDKIYPTYWYGKQHPFEFEFVVSDNPLLHKIFDNLEIISNKAAPESFHYEIIGECYDFAKDKQNMYIRLEATKDLYQNNGYDVLYDKDYVNLTSIHRPLLDKDGNKIDNLFDKSTLFPLYYSRRDSFNEIEDFYHLKDNIQEKDFSALSGGEIVKYENLNEYRIWNHAKAVDMLEKGRIRGNMLYKEDKWNIQINPLNIVLKNERNWTDLNGNSTSEIPVELALSPIPNEVLSKNNLEIPDNFITLKRGYTTWDWKDSAMSEVKLKDKFIKIRIRYSGEDLAIINAIKTLYSISYS